ncbi:MAG: hypothetical protein ACHQF2_06895 [Flavobacteriales bacterium]
MRRIRLLIFAFLLLASPGLTQSYRPSGHHFITNYSAKEYKSSPQSFDITQDNRGIMYFANVGGVLEYDGEAWRTVTIPTQRAFSIEKSNSGIIYVGAQDNFGYLLLRGTEETQYVSLSDRLKNEQVPTIRNILVSGKWIYFFPEPERQLNYFYVFNEQTQQLTKITAKGKILFSGANNNFILIQTEAYGLFTVDKHKLLPAGDTLFWNKTRVKRIFSFDDSLMVCTDKGFYRTNHSLAQLTPVNTLTPLMSSTRFIQKKEWIVSGSNNGVFVYSVKGDLLFPISKKYNLIDNNVLEIFLDKDANLWVATENGISSIDITNGLTYFNFFDGIDGSVDFLGKYRQHVIAQTRSGAFFLKHKIGLDETESADMS